MARRNESDRASELPRHLRKDPARQRQSLASRFNFSWLGGMARQLRSALSKENRAEAQSVRRQSDTARRFRQSELEARHSLQAESAQPQSVATAPSVPIDAREKSSSAVEENAHKRPEQAAPSRDEASASSDEHDELEAGEFDINYDEEDFLPDDAVQTQGNTDIYGGRHDAAFAGDEHSHAEPVHAAHFAADGVDAADIDADDVQAEEELDAEDLEAEELDAEAFDADDLDADDFEAEDFEAEEVDAEDVDADDVEADDVEADDVEADDVDADAVDEDARAEESLSRVAANGAIPDAEYHELANYDAEGEAGSTDEAAIAPVEPSDHEAQEYEPELSSMSVWEGAGFDSYDPAMDIDYDQAPAESEAEVRPAAELDSKPEMRRGSSEPPTSSTSADAAIANADEHELAQVAKPEAAPAAVAASANSASGSAPPLAGSRLEPAKRYVGFHFGPALDAAPTHTASRTENQSSAAREAKPTNPPAPSAPSVHSEDGRGQDMRAVDDDKNNYDENACDELHENVAEMPHAENHANDTSFTQSIDENPYAGLWNLFNVGFTVAPASTPVKEKRARKPRETVSRPEPEVSLADEFHLLAQAAHRVMAGSTLFGGAPATKPRIHVPKESRAPELSPEDQDPALFNRRVSSIAHDLFSNSPLFGGKQSGPETGDAAAPASEVRLQVQDEKKCVDSCEGVSGSTMSIVEDGSAHGEKALPMEDDAKKSAQPAQPEPVADAVNESSAKQPAEARVEEEDSADHSSEDPDAMIVDSADENSSEAEVQVVNDTATEEARQDVEDKSSQQDPEEKPTSERAKRRRLRATTARAKSDSPSESEEQAADEGPERPESRKRKRAERVQRTKPLTRAALRAQKQREATEKAEGSDSEPEPAAKKRNSKSSQKGSSTRRSRNT